MSEPLRSSRSPPPTRANLPTEWSASRNNQTRLHDRSRRSLAQDQRPDVPAVGAGLETLSPPIEYPASRDCHRGMLRVGLEHFRRAAEQLDVIRGCARGRSPGETLGGGRRCARRRTGAAGPLRPTARGWCPYARSRGDWRGWWHFVADGDVGRCWSSAHIDPNSDEESDDERSGRDATRKGYRPTRPYPRVAAD